MISDACGGADSGRALVPGSLRGYRTWRLLNRHAPLPEGALPLTSVTRRVVWPPTLEARCTPAAIAQHAAAPSTMSLGSHRSPSRSCDCGIYAWYVPDDTRILGARVFGAVEASGLVFMGERGFRAERARISAVVTRNRRLAAACAAAGVTVYGRRRDLLRDYPPEDLSGLLAASSTPEPEVHEPSRQGWARFDRVVCLAVWARAALLALAATLLPAGALLASAVLIEVCLFAFVASRAYT
jgi:hypothetical protein